jgi:hypothetical protein
LIGIYIASYLKTALPSLATEIYKDSMGGELQDYILVIDNGFKEQRTIGRRDYEFQILVTSTSDQKAKEKAYSVYSVLTEKYNFEFPSPTGTLNNPLSVQSLKAIQAPQPLGKIGSIYQYTINYEISGGIFIWQQV